MRACQICLHVYDTLCHYKVIFGFLNIAVKSCVKNQEDRNVEEELWSYVSQWFPFIRPKITRNTPLVSYLVYQVSEQRRDALFTGLDHVCQFVWHEDERCSGSDFKDNNYTFSHLQDVLVCKDA